MSQPLGNTFKRLSQLGEDFCATYSPVLEADWMLASDLAQAKLEDYLSHFGRQHPGIEAKTQASLMIASYCWYVFAALIASYLSERRVPTLDIALRWRSLPWHYEGESGESERFDVQFLSSGFYCISQDTEANHPDAKPVANEEALLTLIRSSLESHLDPLIEQLYARTQLGKRALWNLAADSIASLFLLAGEALNMSAQAQREGLDLIQHENSRFRNKGTGYVQLTVLGHTETFRTRGGCCRYYTLPEQDKCTTCVHRSSEDRDARLMDYLTKRFSQS